MVVLAGVECRHRAIDSTRNDDRDLTLKGDERFENGRRLPDLLVGSSKVIAGFYANLTLAIIAVAARLQEALAAECLQCGFQLADAIGGLKLTGLNPDGVEELLL